LKWSSENHLLVVFLEMIPKNDDSTPENQGGISTICFAFTDFLKLTTLLFRVFLWGSPWLQQLAIAIVVKISRFDLFVEIPSSLRDPRVTELFETVCHPLDTWRGGCFFSGFLLVFFFRKRGLKG